MLIFALGEYLKIRRSSGYRSGPDSSGQCSGRVHSADKNALFLNERGGRLTSRSVETILNKYARIAGLKNVTPYTIRHSFATHLTFF